MLNNIINFVKNFNQKFINFFIVNPTSGKTYSYLDGIRAIAVIMVITLHSWGLSGKANILFHLPVTNHIINLTPMISSGGFGVDLFFILSGFLLSQYWLKADYLGQSRPSLLKYFKRRFFRIAPAYYCVLFLVLIFMMPLYINPVMVFSQEGMYNLGLHLIFAQYFFWLSANSFSVLGVLWTLTIEMTFYIVLPYIVILFLRNRWLKTMPITMLITLIWLWLAKYSLQPLINFSFITAIKWSPDYNQSVPLIRHFLANQFPGQLFTFGLGIVLANLVIRRKLGINRTRLFNVLTGKLAGRTYFWLGCFIIIHSMNSPILIFHYYLSKIYIGIGFTLLIAGVEWGDDWVRALFSFTYLRLIGLVGYSMYLLHMPLIHIILKYPSIIALDSTQRFLFVFPIAFTLVLVISMVFFLFIEKPFMLIKAKQ